MFSWSWQTKSNIKKIMINYKFEFHIKWINLFLIEIFILYVFLKLLGVVEQGFGNFTEFNGTYIKISSGNENFIENVQIWCEIYFFAAREFFFNTFLHFEFSMKISSSKKLEDGISEEKSKCKKGVKTKFASCKKINFESNLHFFDEIFIGS